ncbi:purine-cytosine permease family protein [Cryptosporangium phraense]|uniref:Cytosine permease n=1 Tax=Cryptosporangium phraense TaxID=2593070 RepID=A0A545AJN0_9ACTN|nr:cytosine permease [Cryptosporangium phraense]TQS41522.1 cytosine permease [Cryptosporangium phraense]
MTVTEEPIREGEYGTRVVAVEPGGIEKIPLADRHGRPLNLFWTWASPNLEFATIYLGVLATLVFGLTFWQAVLAIVLGNALSSVAHGILSARGPVHGVPEMVLSRGAFGFWGNLLPAGFLAVTAGIGWFAVNSVSATFALNSLTGLPKWLCLVVVVLAQVAIAFFGHNLVHSFERWAFPVLAVIFVIGSVVVLSKSHPGAPAGAGIPGVGTAGGFLLTLAAVFGYGSGWNPYASDYTRYLPPDTNRRAVGFFAGAGIFVTCTLLQIVGAASVTVGPPASDNPTTAFVDTMPSVLANLTLLAIAIGGVSANVLNIYSGSMSFLTMGVRLPAHLRRALVAVTFGVIGFLVALSGLEDAGHKYENFLLVIGYWIAPWLGVVLVDIWLRRNDTDGSRIAPVLYDRRYTNWAGPIAMVLGLVVSIGLFSNQTQFSGYVVREAPSIGDITPIVGFLLAAVVYFAIRLPITRRT